MSCYHPLVGIYHGERTESGAKKFHIQGNIDPSLVDVVWPGSVVIPCGRCIGCRLDYSRSWADRMMLELDSVGSAIFVTLTYDNEHATWCKFDDSGVPLFATLVKRDCQLFLKRLRKYISSYIGDRPIRFYLAGEYGSKTCRPHYHAIIFGLSLKDFPDLVKHGFNELGQDYFISDTLARIWSNGFVLLSDVSWKTCAYVARYCTKKAFGDLQLYLESHGQLPEFALMSRKPGLGASYLESHPDCLDFSSINLMTSEGGLKLRIPKYFLKKLELSDSEKYANIIEQRKLAAQDSMFLKLSKTDLSYLDYLESEENSKLSKIKSLKRDLI